MNALERHKMANLDDARTFVLAHPGWYIEIDGDFPNLDHAVIRVFSAASFSAIGGQTRTEWLNAVVAEINEQFAHALADAEWYVSVYARDAKGASA